MPFTHLATSCYASHGFTETGRGVSDDGDYLVLSFGANDGTMMPWLCPSLADQCNGIP
ncbi:hypothetical protein [Luteibacter sp. UNCMF366Tsu5.1]|uniref:hypothetical protein n=1 Tax=Luteibacter sp. UNCMF366Tsu5.1 TaxID=1502758 RepID=UPI0015A66F36|nr:hypothetical protein [Luteibacter sp. UNCMF366Tsu5.1]